jgi:hypothetical protein
MPQYRRQSRALFVPSLIAAVVLAGRCQSDPTVGAPLGPDLANGTWGGNNAGAIVTDSQAHIHIGCTVGDVSGVVPLSSDGSFSVVGSYVLRAYPVTVGPSLPAQFNGRVQQRFGISTLTLTVVVNDTVAKTTQTLGPVDVTLGKEPTMGICPICRVPQRPAQSERATAPR